MSGLSSAERSEPDVYSASSWSTSLHSAPRSNVSPSHPDTRSTLHAVPTSVLRRRRYHLDHDVGWYLDDAAPRWLAAGWVRGHVGLAWMSHATMSSCSKLDSEAQPEGARDHGSHHGPCIARRAHRMQPCGGALAPRVERFGAVLEHSSYAATNNYTGTHSVTVPSHICIRSHASARNPPQ